MYLSQLTYILLSLSLTLASPFPTPTSTASTTSFKLTTNLESNLNDLVVERDYQVGEVPNFPSDIPSCVGMYSTFLLLSFPLYST